MAYISTEKVKAVRETLKKELPKYKFSVTRNHFSEICINLMEGDIKVDENYQQINQYYLEKYSNEIKNLFENVQKIMFDKAEYFDHSDSQSDYCHVAYFFSFSIGKWDKPYVCKN